MFSYRPGFDIFGANLILLIEENLLSISSLLYLFSSQFGKIAKVATGWNKFYLATEFVGMEVPSIIFLGVLEEGFLGSLPLSIATILMLDIFL